LGIDGKLVSVFFLPLLLLLLFVIIGTVWIRKRAIASCSL